MNEMNKVALSFTNCTITILKHLYYTLHAQLTK